MIVPEPIVPAAPDAGRQNMRLLIQLRWIAIGGQLATIGIVDAVLRVRLPLPPLLLVPAALVLVNLACLPLIRMRSFITNAELTATLLMDVVALGWQLHFSGGLGNPFVSLFLLQVVLGAMLLRPASSWAVVGAVSAALFALDLNSRPLLLPVEYRDNPLGLYIQGTLISFMMIAILLVAFVTRISRNLRDRDAALATARQHAAEEDHIVRMGLLASGAAHELGTPLASLSVLVGDWRHMPRLAGDPDLLADLDDMEQAVKRCKSIVGGILMSAGEARGEDPAVTTMRAFLDDMVHDWRAVRRPGAIRYADRFGEDVTIVADPALRQVIGNVVDNAAEVSPRWIDVAVMREEDLLVIEVADEGPGFAPEILASFGRPYRSTKGSSGRGLGLFLLVNVARKLGGTVSAENREQGGACVRITLPIDALAYHKDLHH